MIKNFRLGIITRMLFLASTLLLLVYLIFESEYYVSMTILCLMIIAQVISLIRYLERTNELLTRFLDAIQYSDFTGSFRNHGLGSKFDELNKAFTHVMERFKEQRAEKEESIRYLETVVQHIGVGLICFNGKGEVVLLNTATKRLFKIATLRKIDSLKELSKPLYKSVQNLRGGNRNLIRVTIQQETLQLAMFATEFQMRNESYKLVSFQNIHSELEEKEMDAWQNLTQVLAHEIMNSITPISSLSATVKMLLDDHTVEKENHAELNKEILADVRDALETIQNRSEGLMRFVNAYRDFTQIPEPKFEIVNVKAALQRTVNLMKTEAAKMEIELVAEAEPDSLEVTADPHLMEQTLINLVKNAIRVLSNQKNGEILLKGRIDESGRVIIEIRDNGPGIKKANSEKIFIPFYSVGGNGKSKGSGIGLSLSKQIMRMHNGTLTVQSEKGKGTVFTMRF